MPDVPLIPDVPSAPEVPLVPSTPEVPLTPLVPLVPLNINDDDVICSDTPFTPPTQTYPCCKGASNEPVIDTEPVNSCVSSKLSPNFVEPDVYIIDELSIYKVLAVISPSTVKSPFIV